MKTEDLKLNLWTDYDAIIDLKDRGEDGSFILLNLPTGEYAVLMYKAHYGTLDILLQEECSALCLTEGLRPAPTTGRFNEHKVTQIIIYAGASREATEGRLPNSAGWWHALYSDGTVGLLRVTEDLKVVGIGRHGELISVRDANWNDELEESIVAWGPKVEISWKGKANDSET